MRHFSKSIASAFMKSRSLSRSLVAASFGATLATAAGAADNELPDPQLKLAREIESPVQARATASPGTPVAPLRRSPARRC